MARPDVVEFYLGETGSKKSPQYVIMNRYSVLRNKKERELLVIYGTYSTIKHLARDLPRYHCPQIPPPIDKERTAIDVYTPSSEDLLATDAETRGTAPSHRQILQNKVTVRPMKLEDRIRLTKIVDKKALKEENHHYDSRKIKYTPTPSGKPKKAAHRRTHLKAHLN